MNPIVINGTVLCDNITGIPRYVYETVVRLDKLIEGTGLDVRIAYRDDGREIHLPELKNIKLVPLKAVKYFYNMAVLPAYLRRAGLQQKVTIKTEEPCRKLRPTTPGRTTQAAVR